MKKRLIKDVLITVASLSFITLLSDMLQRAFNIGGEHITTIFVFSVFVVSLCTDGYVYGFIATVVGVILVNYAFTYPYLEFNFMIPANICSAIVMFTISTLTSTLTTKLKRWQALKSEVELERMRSNLLRAVSHDLRTPLTTIYGSSSAILENDKALTDEQKTRMLNGIKDDSEWLIRMVENLLSITKIDTSSVTLIKTPTVVDELVDSVVLSFKKRYPDVKVTLRLPSSLLLVPMDAMLIKQVLINILENAVHHAEGFTEIVLEVSEFEGCAVFTVSDDGCGIDESILPDIFSGHLRKSENADTKKRNAGIGLSVCDAIIRAHGGCLTAKNKSGGGALICFTLDIEEDGCEQ